VERFRPAQDVPGRSAGLVAARLTAASLAVVSTFRRCHQQVEPSAGDNLAWIHPVQVLTQMYGVGMVGAVGGNGDLRVIDRQQTHAQPQPFSGQQQAGGRAASAAKEIGGQDIVRPSVTS